MSKSVTEEEETTAKILKTTDLIRRGRPVTGTSVLTSKLQTSLSKRRQTDGKPMLSRNTSQSPKCGTLEALSYPAVLVGTLNLPCCYSNNGNSNITFLCNCFQFNDGSATVCCDILGFSPEVIGKNIRVCAWNFIPLKCATKFGGFLEIVRWEFLECISKLSAFPLSIGGSSSAYEGDLKAKYSILGVLESVSPLCVAACSKAGGNSSGDSRNLCGFLSKFLVCECKLCRHAIPRTDLRDLSSQNYKGHCFVKPLTVHYSGSASSWHPAISRLIQNVVSLSGLKKKLVNIGKDSQVMYLTTDKTSLLLPKQEKVWNPNGKVARLRGLGEVGSYAGTVTGIYMQGMVVELDQDLLLLLTDQQLILPHSLRVGAIVCEVVPVV